MAQLLYKNAFCEIVCVRSPKQEDMDEFYSDYWAQNGEKLKEQFCKHMGSSPIFQSIVSDPK